MKNSFLFKLTALTAAVLLSLSTVACSKKNAGIPVSLPDYSDDREIDMYAYVNPTNGDYTYDGIPMNSGKDCRTVEYFKDYMAAGFNIAFARYDSSLPAEATKESWQTSNTKKLCDVAYEAGLRKILITDTYFDRLVRYTGGKLIGSDESDKFANEDEMDADILNRISIYKDVPGFYGVIMMDEPLCRDFDNYALVYKSLKRVMPEIYVHHNLHFCYESTGIYTDEKAWKEKYGKEPTLGEAYKDYIYSFLEKTGAENLAVDIYPFTDLPEERIKRYFYNIQLLQKACNEYGADLSFVMQSIGFTQGEEISKRAVNKNDMWLQMNTLLGFGAKTLSYYTYFPYPSKGANNTVIGTYIDWNGEKTAVYYNGKEVNNAVRKFDNVLLHYDFQGAKVHLNSTIQNGSVANYLSIDSTEFDNSWEHTVLKNLQQDNDALLVTELKDGENDLYMYMIMNAIDSLYSSSGIMSYTECTFTAEFPGYDYVAEFDCGELSYVKLDGGKYTKSLSSGYAVYLVPLKAM